MKKESLADKIASILTTAPSNFDPEDENTDNTQATTIYENVEEHVVNEPIERQIRKQNIDYLADVDERYAGKKGSRNNLNSDEEVSSDENGHDFNSDTSDENGEEPEDSDGFNDNESEDKSVNDNESEESYYSDQEEDQTNFKTLKDDVSTPVKKGRCVKNQMTIWENFLEMRIQVQKCLVAANKMPLPEKYKEIKTELGPEFSTAVLQTKMSISSVLEKFFQLQNLLWKQYPEMKQFNSKKAVNEDGDDENEEIPSDTEDEMHEEKDEEENEESPKKKMKLSDFEKELQDKHILYKDYRNSVIKKWHDKTRLPTLKANTSTHSIIDHIEHTLGDKGKLIKRTQLKRTDYTILGEEVNENDEVPSENIQEEYNPEIFDDNDFYHQLLRELIEVKSADLTDPIQLGRQWMQLQNLRSKMKRKIDTKATKGRKIRYAIHTKLVNFMAPIDNNLWSDEAKTELFGSLFGKNQNQVS